jgi:hypothetical protein
MTAVRAFSGVPCLTGEPVYNDKAPRTEDFRRAANRKRVRVIQGVL